MWAALLLGLLAGFVTIAPAGAQSGTVSLSASVDGHDVAAADANTPLRLQPGQIIDVELPKGRP